MSSQGVPLQNYIAVAVNITPAGASFANFNTLLMLGGSGAIDTEQRYRSYGSIEDVAVDFSTDDPEYGAAAVFFAQSPQPTQLYIGRWARSDTKGRNRGAPLGTNAQAMSQWHPVTNGGFHVSIDGGASTNITGLDFSGAADLDAVAAIIGTALTAASLGATCGWDASQATFFIESASTGTSSSVSALSAPTAGTNIANQLMMDSGDATLIPGIAAETPLQVVTLFDTEVPLSWYGIMFSNDNVPSASDIEAVAGYIEAAANPHLFLSQTGDTNALVTGDTTSVGYALKQAKYNRSGVFWRSGKAGDPGDSAALFGKAFTMNFDGSNTEYTLMWKQLASLTPETALTGTQAQALDANNYSYYTTLNNGQSAVINGKMASGTFFDEMQGIDWLANRIQIEVFNLLQSVAKVPQTDAGNHQLVAAMVRALDAGVNNGLIGRGGAWNAGGFGALVTGQVLPKGYYIYAPPVAAQVQADRAARKSVAFQIAVKLAGAVHDVSIAVNVNP